MRVQPCPACDHPTARVLEASSTIAVVNYHACEACHHVWTTDKKTGEFVKHITPLDSQTLPAKKQPGTA